MLTRQYLREANIVSTSQRFEPSPGVDVGTNGSADGERLEGRPQWSYYFVYFGCLRNWGGKVYR